MNMCESYLIKTNSKITGASSCRCTGIAGASTIIERALHNFKEILWLFGKAMWGWAFSNVMHVCNTLFIHYIHIWVGDVHKHSIQALKNLKIPPSEKKQLMKHIH